MRTPLSLAGLALLILYLIVDRILGMDVFESVGSEGTKDVLESVIDKVFYLAAAALFLGIGFYIFSMVLMPCAKKKSNVRLVS